MSREPKAIQSGEVRWKQANKLNPQADFIRRMLSESCTDQRIPINLSPRFPGPERGPVVGEWMRSRKRAEIWGQPLTSHQRQPVNEERNHNA
jgi:hypothetical protein